MSEADATSYLTLVIGLCQTPRELWTSEDHRILREAREYIQKQPKGKEDKSESVREKPSCEISRDLEGRPASGRAEGKVSEGPSSLKEGAENTRGSS